jgi:hypothetical protein
VPAGQDATIAPGCGPIGTAFHIHLRGFSAGESIDFSLVGPGHQKLLIFPPDAGTAGATGEEDVVFDSTQLNDAAPPHEGVWTITYHGATSNHQATAYFKITPAAGSPPGGSADCSGIPASQNQEVTPACGAAGTRFEFSGSGFKPGELVGIYATMPSGAVFGAPFQRRADAAGRVTGLTLTTSAATPPGIWANTMEGTETHAKSIGYFKVLPSAP